MADNIIDQLKPELDKVKNDISTIVDTKTKAASDKVSALEVDVEGKIKAANDKVAAIEVKFDELDKQIKEAEIAAKRTKLEAEEKKMPFDAVLKSELEKHTDDLAKIARKDNGRQQHLVIDLKAVGDISVGSNVTGGGVYGAINSGRIILNPDRKVHLRDIIPVGNIAPGNEYTFMRENGNGEGDPAFVAEGATKPQFDFDLVEASVKQEVLAGWVRVTRKSMSNIPGFVSYLQTQMPKRLLKAEDAGILYGNGTSPNIKGILTAGNFVASVSTATVLAEKITDDVAELEDTYERDATGILMRPIHYAQFFKNKASGSGEYDLPDNVAIVNGQLFISGVPVYKTTALNINTGVTPDTSDYVVGDFASGTQLLIAEGMRIEFFEQDGTNVRENKVTVRIEETVALPVFGSTFFISGSHTIGRG